MHHSEADSQPAANKSDMWTSFKVSFTALLQNKGFRVRKRNHKFHSTWNKVWGSAGSKDWQKTHDTVTLSTEKEEARSPREKIEDKNSKATYLIYSNIIFIGHYAMFSLMLQRNKLWARHCKACLSKGLCHQTEGRATSGACTRFFTAAGPVSPLPMTTRQGHTINSEKQESKGIIISLTSLVWTVEFHICKPTLDTLKTVVFLQVTHSKRVDKWSEVTKICEQNWASIWGLCFQEIHWSRLIKLPWKSTLFWCWVWNLLFIYSLANLHSTPTPTPKPRLSFQDTMFS